MEISGKISIIVSFKTIKITGINPMRIAICLKQVPDSGVITMDPETHTLVRSSVGVVINPLDEFPLEIALRLKDKLGAEVVAFTMGPPRAEEVLSRAMAMGADRGILLSDAKFAGSDTWGTSLVLAKAIEEYGPFDLAMFGKQAIDGDTAQVGPETAGHLGWPHATGVNNVEIPEPDGQPVKSIKLTRMFEEGSDTVIMKLPAVLMVLKEAGEPRFGTLAGRLEYFNNPPQKAKFADLKLPDGSTGLKGSPTRVVKTEVPKVERDHLQLEGSPGEQASRLAEILKEKIG